MKAAMKAAVISFTATGAVKNRELTALLQKKIPCSGYSFYKYSLEGQTAFQNVHSLAQELFSSCGLLIFIGAAGIAVRAIAPFIREKDQDPAVLVMDEHALHVISLLSGHLGGANDWCRQLALLTGAEPVITTATDLNNVFAVDLFARDNGLFIENRDGIKEVSGRLLHGEKVGFYSELPWEGRLPELLVPCEMGGDGLLRPQRGEENSGLPECRGENSGQPQCGEENSGQPQCREENSGQPQYNIENDGLPECGIVISARPHAHAVHFPVTCRLALQDLTVGIGCRKGVAGAEISTFLETVFQKYGLDKRRIARFASIRQKEKEPGILELAFAERLPFVTFTAQELEAVPGMFAASGFVRKTVGVDNVCERAAALGSGGGKLLVPKQAAGGITIAVAQCMPDIRFMQV